MRPLVIMLCSGLVACDAVHSVPVPAVEPTPPTTEVIATSVLALGKQFSIAEPWETNPLHRVNSSAPGDWIVCLRGAPPHQSPSFAVFFKDGKYLDARVAVLIDECGQGYVPFVKPEVKPEVKPSCKPSPTCDQATKVRK